jgi:hypothetical protein
MSFDDIKVKLLFKMLKPDRKVKMIMQILFYNGHLFSPIKI